MARKTAEELKHEQALAARRARRAKKRNAREAEAAAEMEAVADTEHSAVVAKPAPARVDRAVLGGPSEAALARGAASPKRVTEARENLSSAFDSMGGVPALVAWGRKNPTEFYRIWARLIPKEIPQDPTDKMPLETLLSKLTERAEMSVEEAAAEIGAEALAAAGEAVNVEDAVAAFKGSVH